MSKRVPGPCLLADGALLFNLAGAAEPELARVLAPMPESCERSGLVGRSGSGAELAERLDDLGHTPAAARAALADALALAQEAHRRLPERVRRRLDWPPAAERLTADDWLVAYALDPAGWLLDLAGGLPPALLLRCCLLARAETQAELWLAAEAQRLPRLRQIELHPAPVPAASAGEVLLRRENPEPVRQSPQQP